MLFFGTRDTGPVKYSELYPYLEHITTFAIKRKLKGFNEALKEIRQAAGLEEDVKPIISKLLKCPETASSNPTTSTENNGSRVRKPSSRINIEDFITESTNGKTRSTLKAALTENKSILSNTSGGSTTRKGKLRTDSVCSNGSGTSSKRIKRVSYSGLDFVDYDSLVTNDVRIFKKYT